MQGVDLRWVAGLADQFGTDLVAGGNGTTDTADNGCTGVQLTTGA